MFQVTAMYVTAMYVSYGYNMLQVKGFYFEMVLIGVGCRAC